MHITIQRDNQNVHRTFATLATDEGFLCDIIEPPAQDEAGDDVIRVRMPAGTWILRLRYSPSHNYAVYGYVKVPNRLDLELHPGNVVEHSRGCQCPGDSRATMPFAGAIEDCVTNSRATFKKLMTHLGCPDYLALTNWDLVAEYVKNHPEAAEHTVTVQDI